MLDALSALKHRLFTPASERVQRRHEAPALLSLRNLPDSPPAQARNACVYDGVVCQRPTAADPLQRFSLAPDHGQALVALQPRHRKLLHGEYRLPLNSPHRAALDDFFCKRAELLDEVLGVPHRSTCVSAWPDLAAASRQEDVLRQLLGNAKGLVVGEVHGHASRRLLIGHMALLRRLGVDTLYLERLQGDIHQADLDQLHRDGSCTGALARFLAAQDEGHGTDAVSDATYRGVVDAAFKVGMRIVALDLMTSHHLHGVQAAVTDSTGTASDIRIKVFNHVAATRIAHDQQQQIGIPGAQRWIALVGCAHAGTFNGIAGIAERLGAPSLRVEDASPSWSDRIQAGCDPGRTTEPTPRRSGGGQQCDYLLKVPAGDGRARPDTPAPCSAAQAQLERQRQQALVATVPLPGHRCA